MNGLLTLQDSVAGVSCALAMASRDTLEHRSSSSSSLAFFEDEHEDDDRFYSHQIVCLVNESSSWYRSMPLSFRTRNAIAGMRAKPTNRKLFLTSEPLGIT